MRYKKDPWYIAGLITTALSVAVFVITMILMYFESDGAIIWCFASMVTLAVGILMSQTVKRRYEEADVANGEPLPMFWSVRFAFHNLKINLGASRLWRRFFVGLCGLFVAVAVILGGLCVYWLCRASAIKNSQTYTEAVAQYNVYYAQWQEARRNGDEDAKTQAFAKMQEYDEIAKEHHTDIKKYNQNINNSWPWIAFSGACAVFCGTMLYVYGIKPQAAEKQSDNKK